ncbi:PAS domain-containing sensor histidine kinase [Burkholderia sp. JP2-270]|uniref:sensor histidine kinase n=1 Tax=Burkholderia sp. JP2-270 TaxID=2217913 RepID=UPI0013A6E1B7|nr:PAS domain-containing sensor histidine kinase [Burkholderia sp. JP2-270]
MNAINEFFVSAGFMPSGYCFYWSPILLWAYVISDMVIALACYAIAVVLWIFMRRRTALSFSWPILTFAFFVFACGTTHLTSVLNIWQPDYWLDACLKAVTAMTSLATVALVWPMTPKAFAPSGPNQPERANNDMLREVAALRNAEEQLQALNRELEDRVAQHTAALEGVADALRRKSAELEHVLQSLRDDEARTRLVVDTALDAVITMNADGVVVGWNLQAAAIFGWQTDDAVGRVISELIILPCLWEPHAVGLRRYLQTGEETILHRRLELTALHRDGHEIPVELTITPIHIGERQYFSGFLRDITARKETERALHDSEKRFRATFQQAAVGIAHVGPDGRWLRVNEKLCDIVGYTREELLSLTFQDITHPDDLGADLAQVHQVLDGQVDTYTMEKRYLRRNGSEVWIALTVSLVRDDAGTPDYFISVVEDIQRRKVAEEELRQRTEELARSNQDLEYFAYVASHDLQEPLRAVSGSLQLLKRRYEGKLDARADEFIGHAVDGAVRMAALIGDLLAYSRVGRREDPRRLTECDEALDSALKNLSVAIRETGAQVTRGSLPAVLAISAQLPLLFQNLVGNAIKFRRKDVPVQIYVGAEARDDVWVFRVADNGIGIESQYFERIFLVFQRLQTRRDYPGTGIGLALCKRIVERHGGHIWVESEPGKGSTFLFTLPRGPE